MRALERGAGHCWGRGAAGGGGGRESACAGAASVLAVRPTPRRSLGYTSAESARALLNQLRGAPSRYPRGSPGLLARAGRTGRGQALRATRQVRTLRLRPPPPSLLLQPQGPAGSGKEEVPLPGRGAQRAYALSFCPPDPRRHDAWPLVAARHGFDPDPDPDRCPRRPRTARGGSAGGGGGCRAPGPQQPPAPSGEPSSSPGGPPAAGRGPRKWRIR